MGGQADQRRGSWPCGCPGGGWDASPGLSAPSLWPPCLPGPHLEPPQEWQCLGHPGGRRPSRREEEPEGAAAAAQRRASWGDRPGEGTCATNPTQDRVLPGGGQCPLLQVVTTPLNSPWAFGCFCMRGLRIRLPAPQRGPVLETYPSARPAGWRTVQERWRSESWLCSWRQVSEHL